MSQDFPLLVSNNLEELWINLELDLLVDLEFREVSLQVDLDKDRVKLEEAQV